MSESVSLEALRAELAENEEKLRKVVRHLDQIARTEFRDRAQRLKQLRAEREELVSAVDALKARIKQME